MIIDSHCHLYDQKLDQLLPTILKESKEQKVLCICCGADVESSKKCVELAEENEFVFATVGIHPEDITTYKKEDLLTVETLAKSKKVVAIGEIGLDYFYDKNYKIEQKKLLESQILLADKLALPCVFHVRDAMGDFLEIINNHKNFFKHSAVVHSFSGSVEVAKILVEKGFCLGINGIVTFKNARQLLDVVREIPLEKLLIETDSPYLTPEPHRGKINQPKFVKFVAKKVAEIKGITEEKVIEICNDNAKKLFGI